MSHLSVNQIACFFLEHLILTINRELVHYLVYTIKHKVCLTFFKVFERYFGLVVFKSHLPSTMASTLSFVQINQE